LVAEVMIERTRLECELRDKEVSALVADMHPNFIEQVYKQWAGMGGSSLKKHKLKVLNGFNR